MNKYKEVWDESHYKYGAAKDLKHVSWEEFKTIRKAEIKHNSKRVILEVGILAVILVGLYYVGTLFVMV